MPLRVSATLQLPKGDFHESRGCRSQHKTGLPLTDFQAELLAWEKRVGGKVLHCREKASPCEVHKVRGGFAGYSAGLGAPQPSEPASLTWELARIVHSTLTHTQR